MDRFFTMGPGTPVTAQDIFTNRSSELASFSAALSDFPPPDPVATVEDVRGPRRNVLVYYGMGGIGKTRLSRELELQWHAGDVGAPDPDLVRLSYRIDFDEGSAADLEAALLGLRATLGQHRRVWPAFDLGFAGYWERAHPGVPLQVALKEMSSLRRLGRELDLGEQLKDAVEYLLDAPGGVLGIFMAGARVLGRSAVEQMRERRLLQECPFFPPFLSEDTDPASMRPYLAALLAWDLARVQREQPLQVVTFLDTWERIQEHRSDRGGLEDLLSRLVHVMPNVLFVVTGRNQLRWADPDQEAVMLWSGPTRWPGLAPGADGEPRQHLVGGLSDVDAARYLQSRLVRGGEPAIPAEIRTAVIDAAEGLPLYLDLAATHFDELVARGEEPGVEDFGDPLPSVILRIMRDLDREERVLLRAGSLVHAFDEDLLRAAAPEVPDACVRRFLGRAFVRRNPDGWAPYSLHETLRGTVRDQDVAHDGWSGREWALASERLLEELHRRASPELAASGSVDRSLLIGIFMDAFRLAVLRGDAPVWVVETAARLQSIGAWGVLAWTDSCTTDDSALHPLARGLAAIGRRHEIGSQATAADLERALADPRLGTAARDYLTIWLGWMMDALERREDAAELRLAVAVGDGPFAAHARHAVGRGDWVDGRLGRSRSWEFDDHDPLQRFWGTGLRGRTDWIMGRFEAAEESLRERIAAAEVIGSPELIAHALRTLGESRCWSDPGGPADDSQQAVEIYRRMNKPISQGEALTSSVVIRVGLDGPDTYVDELARAHELMRGGGYVDVAWTFSHCVHGDLTAARRARDRFVAGRRGRAYGFWDAITGWWIEELSGRSEPVGEVAVDWLHGEDEARRNWVGVLQRRRALVSG